MPKPKGPLSGSIDTAGQTLTTIDFESLRIRHYTRIKTFHRSTDGFRLERYDNYEHDGRDHGAFHDYDNYVYA